MLVLILATIVACKTKAETEMHSPSEAQTVLVQLIETATPEDLEQQFKMVDLQHKKRISNTMRIYLLTFNSQKVTLGKLLEQLKESELVLKAQANQSVSNRN